MPLDLRILRAKQSAAAPVATIECVANRSRRFRERVIAFVVRAGSPLARVEQAPAPPAGGKEGQPA